MRDGVVEDRFTKMTAIVISAEILEESADAYRDSIAYPPNAHDDRTPLHIPIAIGSAVW